MSWHCVPVSAGWSSDCTSPSPEQIQSYLSSKIPLHARCSRPDGPECLSGTMCAPSTPRPGPDELTLSPPDSLASPGPTQASAKAPRINAGSGPGSHTSFARYHPDTSCWKTSSDLLPVEDWPSFVGRWPRWGMIVRGECLIAPPWEPVTAAKECLFSGIWPTPLATDFSGAWKQASGSLHLTGQARVWHLTGKSLCHYSLLDQEQIGIVSRVRGGRLSPLFVEWLMGFPRRWSLPDATVSGHWATQCRHLLQQWLGESSRVA